MRPTVLVTIMLVPMMLVMLMVRVIFLRPIIIVLIPVTVRMLAMLAMLVGQIPSRGADQKSELNAHHGQSTWGNKRISTT
jgi:hypothetical protein